MTRISVVQAGDQGWEIAPGPGGGRSNAGQLEAFTSPDGKFQTGLWWREPDEWEFARAYDEVAFITGGDADVELADGRVLTLGAGDILVTPFGTAGRWRVRERVTKFYAIYEAPDMASGSPAALIRGGDEKDWVVLETEPGDPNEPGREWYAFRSSDGQFSTGVWSRVPETGPVDKSCDEVSLLLQGEVDIDIDIDIDSAEGGSAVAGAPGDVLVTAKGCRGTWRARSFIEKFWAVYHG